VAPIVTIVISIVVVIMIVVIVVVVVMLPATLRLHVAALGQAPGHCEKTTTASRKGRKRRRIESPPGAILRCVR
jgi:hypothetical protein